MLRRLWKLWAIFFTLFGTINDGGYVQRRLYTLLGKSTRRVGGWRLEVAGLRLSEGAQTEQSINVSTCLLLRAFDQKIGGGRPRAVKKKGRAGPGGPGPGTSMIA